MKLNGIFKNIGENEMNKKELVVSFYSVDFGKFLGCW